MTKRIVLNAKDIEKLYRLTEEFSDVNEFTVSCDSSSGIGKILQVEILTKLGNYPGTFKLTLTDESDW